MPTATVNERAFQTAIANCVDSIGSQDWGAAARYYAQAEAIHGGLLLLNTKGDTTQRRRENLDGLRRAIEMARDISNSEDADDGRFITTTMGF